MSIQEITNRTEVLDKAWEAFKQQNATRLEAINKGDFPMRNKMTFGAYHIWDKGGQRVEVSGCETQEIAFDRVADMLRMDNWKLPKWWQFWRWDESIPSWLCDRFKDLPSRDSNNGESNG